MPINNGRDILVSCQPTLKLFKIPDDIDIYNENYVEDYWYKNDKLYIKLVDKDELVIIKSHKTSVRDDELVQSNEGIATMGELEPDNE
jgi:hypothetical protein